MAIYLQPQIGHADYKAFKRLMPDDANLPEAYRDWLDDQAHEHSKITKAGHLVKEIPVQPDEFVRYCRLNATKTDSFALADFTASKAMKEKLLAARSSTTGQGLIDVRK